MGRRAKPVALHLVTGNKNRLTKAEIEKRKAGEEKVRPPSDGVKPPSWLGRKAKTLFRRLVKDMKETELYTNVDVETMAVYCDAVERYAQAAEEIDRNGITIMGAQGAPIQNPAVLVATKYASIISRCASKLGLDPSSRASLAIPREEPKKETTPFEAMYADV